MDDAVPGLMVLGCLRKQAEQALRSKPVNSTPSWPLHQLTPPGFSLAWAPVLTFFSDGPQYGIVSPINPSLPSSLDLGISSQQECPKLGQSIYARFEEGFFQHTQVTCSGICCNPWKYSCSHRITLGPTKLVVTFRYLCSSPGPQ